MKFFSVENHTIRVRIPISCFAAYYLTINIISVLGNTFFFFEKYIMPYIYIYSLIIKFVHVIVESILISLSIERI